MNKKTTPTVEDIGTLPLEDDTEARQLVMRFGEHRARMEYDRDGDRIFLTNLAVPRPLQEQGVADPFAIRVMQWVEERNLKVIPTHPVIKDFLRRNAAWKRLLLKGVEI
jgi:predicted GNAT family acetyltransferase